MGAYMRACFAQMETKLSGLTWSKVLTEQTRVLQGWAGAWHGHMFDICQFWQGDRAFCPKVRNGSK
jgi:hypothetical protein